MQPDAPRLAVAADLGLAPVLELRAVPSGADMVAELFDDVMLGRVVVCSVTVQKHAPFGEPKGELWMIRTEPGPRAGR